MIIDGYKEETLGSPSSQGSPVTKQNFAPPGTSHHVIPRQVKTSPKRAKQFKVNEMGNKGKKERVREGGCADRERKREIHR